VPVNDADCQTRIQQLVRAAITSLGLPQEPATP
jgi:hypothetical protein